MPATAETPTLVAIIFWTDMTTLTTTEIIDGDKNKLRLQNLFATVISILWLPFTLLKIILGKQNYLPIDTSSWTSWYSVNGQGIERNLIGETGFDGVIKFYRLRTSDEQINKTLQGKIFGDFHCETNYGLFLREFKNPDDWPTSYLVFVDKESYTYRRLQKTNSSWTDWKYEFINDSDFNIITESADTYTRRIKITATNNSYNTYALL